MLLWPSKFRLLRSYWTREHCLGGRLCRRITFLSPPLGNDYAATFDAGQLAEAQPNAPLCQLFNLRILLRSWVVPYNQLYKVLHAMMKFLVMPPLTPKDFHFIQRAHGLVVPLFISITPCSTLYISKWNLKLERVKRMCVCIFFYIPLLFLNIGIA